MLAFSPFGGRRTSSGLFTSVQGWGDYSKAKDIYIIDVGDECGELNGELPGTKLWVGDGFELQATQDLWSHFQDNPEFKGLKDSIDFTEGGVKTVSVHFKALLAIG